MKRENSKVENVGIIHCNYEVKNGKEILFDSFGGHSVIHSRVQSAGDDGSGGDGEHPRPNHGGVR